MKERKEGRALGRRDFVRTTSGFLLGGAIVGCDEEIGAVAKGTLRFVISGLSAGFSDAGSVQVSGGSLAAPVQVALGAVATDEISVSAATYIAVYTPPAGYSMANGQSNVLEVSVVAGEITEVAVAVVAATGTLSIVITGLAAGAGSGGSAQALRTDIAGQSPLAIAVPGNGSASQSVVPGTYNVTYTPPGGFTLATANPQVAVVAASGTGTANFTITVSAPPPAVLFHSDWGTAVGTDVNAVRDMGKGLPWNIQGGQGLEVISSAGLDFPTTNVLRVTAVAASQGYAFLRRTSMPIPAVGESRYYRWYMRVCTPNGLEDPESHPVQDGNAGSQCNWLFHVYHDAETPGFWRPQFRPNGNVNGFPNMRFMGPMLPKNVTFRFELQVLRTSATTFQMHARIYDSTGALIHGDSSFTNDNGSGTLASNPTHNLRDAAAMDGMNAGCNGIAGAAPPFPFVYAYEGAFAVSSQDWLGPYSGGI